MWTQRQRGREIKKSKKEGKKSLWKGGDAKTMGGKTKDSLLKNRNMLWFQNQTLKKKINRILSGKMVKRWFVYNIFIINNRLLVSIDLNLNLILRLFFFPTIIISNNLSLKICYKNVSMKILWTYHFSKF